jgi:hypothetical protein
MFEITIDADAAALETILTIELAELKLIVIVVLPSPDTPPSFHCPSG